MSLSRLALICLTLAALLGAAVWHATTGPDPRDPLQDRRAALAMDAALRQARALETVRAEGVRQAQTAALQARDMAASLDQALQARQALQGEQAVAAQALAEARRRLDVAQAELDQAREALAARDASQAILEAQRAALEIDKTALETRIAALHVDKDALEARVGALQADKAGLLATLAALDAAIAALRGELATLRQANASLAAALAEARARLDETTQARPTPVSVEIPPRNATPSAPCDGDILADQLEALRAQCAALAEDKARREREAADLAEALRQALQRQLESRDVAVSVHGDNGAAVDVTILGEILFASGGRMVRREGLDVLRRLGPSLATLPAESLVMVLGHTDDQPPGPRLQALFPTNWELSMARAAAVSRELQTLAGLPPRRVLAMGRADSEPVAPNDTAEGRARNRRVEIRIGPACPALQ